MLAETSSPEDDVESVTTNTDVPDSYHGKQKVGEAVQRREAVQMGELTPIRAAILYGRA